MNAENNAKNIGSIRREREYGWKENQYSHKIVGTGAQVEKLQFYQKKH